MFLHTHTHRETQTQTHTHALPSQGKHKENTHVLSEHGHRVKAAFYLTQKQPSISHILHCEQQQLKVHSLDALDHSSSDNLGILTPRHQNYVPAKINPSPRHVLVCNSAELYRTILKNHIWNVNVLPDA